MVGTFHKTDKKIFIFISFSIQKMCVSEISGSGIFSHVNQLISRIYAESRVKRYDDSPNIVGIFTEASFFQIGSVQHNCQIEP